jgi:drug/metabolite transporter (DMT)-like permease
MSSPRRVSHPVAVVVLAFTCVLWATSFAGVKICGAALMKGAAGGVAGEFGPVLLTAVRFTIALPLLLIFWKSARAWRPRRADVVPLLKVAVPMAVGFLVQAAGLATVPATLSGFITGLCVCLTPAFEWAIHGRRPSWRLLVGVLLAVGGVSLMTLTAESQEWRLSWGVLLTCLCVVAFTLQIVYTGESSEKLGAASLTVGSFAFTAVCAWAVALVMAPGSIPGALTAAAGSGRFWFYFAILLVCATIGAMVLMNAFQRYIRPSEAAVVYTSEPVFAAIFAFLFIGAKEIPGTLGLVGAGMMLLANLVVALKKRSRQEAPPGAPILPREPR